MEGKVARQRGSPKLARPVASASGAGERPALDALLQRPAEAQRTPVLASERLADLLARKLATVLEQVLDQGHLAIEPELLLVDVLAGRHGVRAPAAQRPAVHLAGHRLTSRSSLPRRRAASRWKRGSSPASDGARRPSSRLMV